MASLRMVWNNQEPAPVHLAEGCTVFSRAADRFTKEEMADGWTDACTELCGGIRWSREQFYRDHWEDPAIPEDGVFFAATPEGRIFSTASVQILPGHVGNLHMVGTASDCKGLGGGRAVCTEAIRYFQRHEITLAYLSTDDFRVPAIRIYLGLGYRPYLCTPEAPEIWHQVMEKFGIPVLDAYDTALHPMTLFFRDTPAG